MGQRQEIMDREPDKEIPDTTPVHVPGNTQKPPSLREDMRRFIREELSKQAQVHEAETFEDADDFEEENPDLDMLTAYTVIDLKPEEGQMPYDLEANPSLENTEASADGAEGAEGSEATETPAPSPVPNVE